MLTQEELQDLAEEFIMSDCDPCMIDHLGRNDLRQLVTLIGRAYTISLERNVGITK